MYRVGKGQKIKNVKDDEKVRHYYGGELLPKGYSPPASYITQKIVEEVKHGCKNGAIR